MRREETAQRSRVRQAAHIPGCACAFVSVPGLFRLAKAATPAMVARGKFTKPAVERAAVTDLPCLLG